MKDSLRASYGWLHTWAGVVLGGVLFAIFWMGTLSVFDREIDRWMMPDTRIEQPAALSWDKQVVGPVQSLLADKPNVAQWGATVPSERVPTMRVFYREANATSSITRHLDTAKGEFVPDQGTLAGTGFIFPFHFMLHIKWERVGYWIVGAAAMGMLVLMVSGVIIHRKIFAEFFTFRPRKQLRRSTLDLHNVSGVLGLPFHFVMALSGLIIFIGIYYPQAHVGAYGASPKAQEQYNLEARGAYKRPKANAPGELASIDAMVREAEAQWPGGQAFFVRVWHPGDANAYVEVRRSYKHDVTMHLDRVTFDGTTGAVLHRFSTPPVGGVQRFISGIHFIQFEHWTLRWLYFAAGVLGCIMIATGMMFWVESRRKAHLARQLPGVRFVEVLTIGSVSGIIIATLAFFIANKLMPLGIEGVGLQRDGLEMAVFYAVWLITFGWAWASPRWQPQVRAIGVLCLVAALLNGVTTGDWLHLAIARGQWGVAGMDAMLLAAGALALGVAMKLAARSKASEEPSIPGGRGIAATGLPQTVHQRLP
jgi:uncharacterized iron-regulated membrane protein